MREEKVTKNILNWLQLNDWEIICFDFPQSGTGLLLHINNDDRAEKNKGGIIPDIIAVKNITALFFENKDRFYQSDFDKLEDIKLSNDYSTSLNSILSGKNIKAIYYGVGLPSLKDEIEKSENHLHKIDFLISTNVDGIIQVHQDNYGIFSNA